MGGTFDPIHFGHLILAEQAREAFDLERVLFVTASVPPHKAGAVVSSAEDRFEMVRIAIEGESRFECSRIELDRPGPSYTIDTLRALRANYLADTHVYLLLGADEARDFPLWREPRGIQELATVVVANRPGIPHLQVPGDIPLLPPTLGEGRGGVFERMAKLEMPGVDICSTDIRRRVAEGRSIRYLVPAGVEEYILEHRLYVGGNG
jgi:nicotinate-nucleotide adenylyltransferase